MQHPAATIVLLPNCMASHPGIFSSYCVYSQTPCTSEKKLVEMWNRFKKCSTVLGTYETLCIIPLCVCVGILHVLTCYVGYMTLFLLISLLFGKFSEVNAEMKYRAWLQDCYEDTLMRLLAIMSKHKTATQLQALSTMMKLLSLEGKYPIDCGREEGYYFPVQKLRVSIC